MTGQNVTKEKMNQTVTGDSGEKKVSGFNYLWCALYACAAFAIELLLVTIEKAMGMDTLAYTTSQNIIHWIITAVLWISAGVFITQIGKKTTGFDIFEHREKIKPWQILAILVCLGINIFVKYLDWGGLKVVIEWQNLGPVLFVFQYIYYLAEGFLIAIVVVFGQKACEKWFKNDRIPYGGIVLAIGWGLMHMVTKGSIATGLLCALAGFLYGTAYMFVNRDFHKSVPLLSAMFIL